MNTQKFSKGEAIRFGWDTMKKNFWLLVWIFGLAGSIYMLPSIISSATEESAPLFSNLIGFIGWILSMGIQMGMIVITLAFVDGRKPKTKELFSRFTLIFKYIGASILYALIIVGGLILFIIPGLVWGIKFQFFGYFIVEDKVGPIEALKRSAAITHEAKWNLFLLGLLLGLINLAGALCLFIGLLATMPATTIAYAYVYRKLKSQAV